MYIFMIHDPWLKKVILIYKMADFFHSYVGVRGGYRLGSSLDEACGLAIQFLWARFFSDIFGETCGREGTKADND